MSCMKALTTLSNIQGRTPSKFMVSPKIYTLLQKMWSSSWLLNEPVWSEDIGITHKIYSGKNEPRNIIVKFISHRKKTALYKNRTALKNVRISQLFPDCSAATASASKRLYSNENLAYTSSKRLNEGSQPNEKGWNAVQCLWMAKFMTLPEGAQHRESQEDLDNLWQYM